MMEGPNPNYELYEGDKVFVKIEDRTEYYILKYEISSASWMMTPYTNKEFHTKKTDKNGFVIPEFLFVFGYDDIKRVGDFDFESLK
jgi:hypothetical protein